MQEQSEIVEKSVVVLQASPHTRRMTTRAVAATGARCVAPKTAEEALEYIAREHVDLVVGDWENAPPLEQVARDNPKLEVVLLTNEPVFERHAQDIMVFPMSSMIVSSFVAMPEINDPVATRELVTTVAKLFTGDIFGLEKYLGWGAAVRTRLLTSSAEADGVVESSCEAARRAGMAERDVSNLGLLVDELLTNAIWDAPIDEHGVSKYHDKSRGEAIQLLPNEAVTVRYGSDGNVFALSTVDNFGRLEHDLAIKYIRKCFRADDQGVSQGTGGAGLGLYMAYNSVSSFVINVDPGHRTEVIGLIRLGRSVRGPGQTSHSASRSLCYFRARKPPESE